MSITVSKFSDLNYLQRTGVSGPRTFSTMLAFNYIFGLDSLRTPPRHPPTPAQRPRSARQVGGVRGRASVVVHQAE